MRILQIIQKPQRRGAEIFAFQLSNRFEQEGHEVRKIYLYPAPPLNALPLLKADLVIGTDERHISEKFPGWNPKILKNLQSIVADFHPDVVQVNAARTVKYGALLKWKSPNSPWILIYRNIGDPSVWLHSRLRKWIFELLVLSRVDGIVAVSSRSFDLLKSSHGKSSRAMIQIPRGVDPEEFVPRRSREDVRKQRMTSESANVLISVGSLTREKRLDRLLRIVRNLLGRHKNLALWIVGEGEQRKELENYSNTLGIASSVQFLGSQQDVASLYNAADLHILTSDTEGIPGVVLEAALVAVPSVATRVGGVADCIVDQETGLLVNPEKEAEMVDAVEELLKFPEKRRMMGERARMWVKENFSLPRISATYLRFYETLLENRTTIDARIQKHETV